MNFLNLELDRREFARSDWPIIHKPWRRIQWLTVVGAFPLDAVAVRVLVVGRDSQDAADAVSVGSGRRRVTRRCCRCMGYHRHGTTWSRLTLLLTLLLLRLLLLMRVLRLLRRLVPHDSTDNARRAAAVCIELHYTVARGVIRGELASAVSIEFTRRDSIDQTILGKFFPSIISKILVTLELIPVTNLTHIYHGISKRRCWTQERCPSLFFWGFYQFLSLCTRNNVRHCSGQPCQGASTFDTE